MRPANYIPLDQAVAVDITGNHGAMLEVPGTLHVYDEPHPGWATHFLISADGQSVGAVEVRVSTANPSQRITSADLRKVRATELLREHLPQFVRDIGGTPLSAPTVEEFKAIRKQRGQLLRFVADRYNLALALGLHPNKYVQELTGSPRATVSEWVRACRDLEMIDG